MPNPIIDNAMKTIIHKLIHQVSGQMTAEWTTHAAVTGPGNERGGLWLVPMARGPLNELADFAQVRANW